MRSTGAHDAGCNAGGSRRGIIGPTLPILSAPRPPARLHQAIREYDAPELPSFR